MSLKNSKVFDRKIYTTRGNSVTLVMSEEEADLFCRDVQNLLQFLDDNENRLSSPEWDAIDFSGIHDRLINIVIAMEKKPKK